MLKEKKYLGNGRGNFDDADFVIGPDEWVNLENCRIRTTDAGVTGTIESVGSAIQKTFPAPSITHTWIGGAEDDATGIICYFLCNNTTDQHKIIFYEVANDTAYNLLLSTQVNGGLGFDINSLIHSARIENGCLFWVEGETNEPRRINIYAALKLNNPSYPTDVAAYTAPINQEVITIIRRPPFYALTVEKDTALGYVNNFIKNDAFQFSVRYRYRDYEYSKLGEISVLAPYNTTEEAFNFITVTMPNTEFIDQDVIEADLCVRYGNTGITQRIHTWTRTDIDAHNTGVPLTYDFYNDVVGDTIDPVTANTPFDSVPIFSDSLEFARNRLFLSNNVEGYDTPATTSLTVAVATPSETGEYDAVYGLYTMVFYNGDTAIEEDGWIVVFIPTLGTYYVWNDDQLPPYDATHSVLDADFGPTTNITDIGSYLINSGNIAPPLDWTNFTDSIDFNNALAGLPQSLTVTDLDLPLEDGQRSFKSEGVYGGGVVFFDKFRRKCGVVTSPTIKAEMPPRTFDTAVFNVGMSWMLSNTGALFEIPDWAYYYAPARTQNLRTRFFMQARAVALCYVIKGDDGVFDYTATAYNTDRYGIGIDITTLFGFGMGYIFTEGDIIELFFETNPPADTELSIIGQDGKWLIAQLKDIGSVAAITPLFEIYTPYKRSTTEGYFEVGQVYSIVNPTTSLRTYSTLGGLFNGDVYILTRGAIGDQYFTENMSPNDKFWRNWFTDIGWINIIDTIGQQDKTNSISWSNTYIQGTKSNGLSTFDALDEESIPLECGEIMKLQLTSKIQNEKGVVMLGICQKETASLYIGETQQYGSDSSTTITVSTNVIGTINILKGSYGTLNPESVVSFRGNVFWVDVINGAVIQYSGNGLFPISNFKMTRFWKQFCDQYRSMTAEQIMALGSRPFVFTAIDPRHYELVLSIPKLLNIPPKGYLPDYPSMIYPWDIWDGQGKTIVYKLDIGTGNPFWQGAYAFNPEGFITLQNNLYSFRSGHLFLHNSTESYGEFYGVQYKARIMHMANQEPSRPKIYLNQSIEANLIPTLTYYRSESPYTQASDLMDYDYRDTEGIFYSVIYRNKLVPTQAGLDLDGLLTAEVMRTNVLRVLLEFSATTTPVELRFVTIGYQLSRGHNT